MRKAWFLSPMVAVCCLLGVATAASAATPLPYSQLQLGAPGGAATIVGNSWHSTGAKPCTIKPSVTFTGTAQLLDGGSAGGQLSLVMAVPGSSRRSVQVTGPVYAAGSSELELQLASNAAGVDDYGTLYGEGTTFSGTATVSGRPGCLFSSPVTLTLAGTGLTVATSTPSAQRTDLGGLNVDGYCQSTSKTTAEIPKGSSGPDVAFGNWRCGPNGAPLDMQTLCDATYAASATSILAVATDPNNALSWQCYGVAATSTSTTTTTTTTLGPTGHTSNGQHNGDVATIASKIGTPGQVFHSLGHDVLGALLTVGVMLFIAFPANIFNQTFHDHYEEILDMVAGARRRVRAALGLHEPDEDAAVPEPGAHRTAGSATRGWFVATLLFGAVLGGLLKPSFGANASSAEDLAATLFAFAFGAAVSFLVARAFRRHHRYEHHTYLKALPLGLAVAAVCVVVSRVSDFAPGYLYGVVVGIAFVESISDRHNAHLTALSALSTLAVAICAWLEWIPVNHLALEPGSSPILVVLDDTLGSIFIAGLVGTVINMLPLRGLPGGTLVGWRRDAWAGVCFLALFLLIQVELFPASGPTHSGGAPVVTAAVLFVAFGALSFGFRGYFQRRERAAATVAPPPLTPGPTEAVAE